MFLHNTWPHTPACAYLCVGDAPWQLLLLFEFVLHTCTGVSLMLPAAASHGPYSFVLVLYYIRSRILPDFAIGVQRCDVRISTLRIPVARELYSRMYCVEDADVFREAWLPCKISIDIKVHNPHIGQLAHRWADPVDPCAIDLASKTFSHPTKSEAELDLRFSRDSLRSSCVEAQLSNFSQRHSCLACVTRLGALQEQTRHVCLPCSGRPLPLGVVPDCCTPAA